MKLNDFATGKLTLGQFLDTIKDNNDFVKLEFVGRGNHTDDNLYSKEEVINRIEYWGEAKGKDVLIESLEVGMGYSVMSDDDTNPHITWEIDQLVYTIKLENGMW